MHQWLLIFAVQVKGAVLELKLLRGHQGSAVNPDVSPGRPLCSFVNVQFCGGAKPRQGTVLLENPRGTSDMTLDQLKRQVRRVVLVAFCSSTCKIINAGKTTREVLLTRIVAVCAVYLSLLIV